MLADTSRGTSDEGVTEGGPARHMRKHVQLPFVTSLFPLNNWFWNHNRLFESGGSARAQTRRHRQKRTNATDRRSDGQPERATEPLAELTTSSSGRGLCVLSSRPTGQNLANCLTSLWAMVARGFTEWGVFR